MTRFVLTLAVVLQLAACGGSLSFDGDTSAEATARASSGIQVRWSADVDQRRPMDPSGFSQPVVHQPSSTIIVGGRDGYVHLYNMNGSERGRVSVHEGVESGGLALPGGLVVVGDIGGVLYGIDPVAAAVKWEYQLSSALVGRPIAAGDDLILQTQDNRLYRIGADGQKQWSYAGVGGGLGLYLGASPLMIGDVIYAVFSNGDAVAVKADSGDLVWRRQLLLDADAAVLRELKAPIADPVQLDRFNMGMQHIEDALLVSFYQGEVLILSRTDGSQLLTQPMSLKSAPLILDGALYIAAADGSLQAIDMDAGTVRWSKKLSAGELVGPVLDGSQLWLADDRGHVFRVSADGEKIDSIELAGRVDRLPVVTAQGVLVRTNRGALHMLR